MRISKLPWETRPLLCGGSSRPFWKSPIKNPPLVTEKTYCDWQLCSLILDLESNWVGDLCWFQPVTGGIRQERWIPCKAKQCHVPLSCPTPRALWEMVLVHFSFLTRTHSQQAVFKKKKKHDIPEESYSLRKVFLKNVKPLKYKLSNCHQLVCALGKKVKGKYLVPGLACNQFGLCPWD